MERIKQLKQQARQLKRDVHALYFACQDSRMPWYAKLIAAIVVAYALSPIDLIPDFIPILGYLDDLILVPLGIALLLKLIPPIVMAEARRRADAAVEAGAKKPVNWDAAYIIVGIWIGLGLGILILLFQRLHK